jgi:trk system potassium uptake protein TrkH
MLRILLVLAVTGRLVRYFTVAFIPPTLLALYEQEWLSAGSFLASAILGAVLGHLASRKYETPRLFHRSEAMAVVAFTWLFAALVAALPYMFMGFSFEDAFFESMSGMTTTGATILTNFESYDRSFFLWRAMTQWFGGLGVIALFVVVLPRLGIAGRQLFFAEASTAPSDAVSPQIRRSAGSLWKLYVALTGLCAIFLACGGMSLYESLLHAMTTLSAGGFSPQANSIAAYSSSYIEWVLIGFMFVAGASFPLQLRAAMGEPLVFLKDDEFLFYLFATILGGILLAALLEGFESLDAVRTGLFQSASLISSTGYASVDYNEWPDSARSILLIIMLLGGCAGSAAGGPKAIRHLLVGRTVLREVRQVLHPRAVLPLRYRGRAIPDQVLRAVFSLVALYVAGYLILGALLIFLGMEPIAALTASVACFGNVGPGLDAVGPMANFAHVGTPAKFLLSIAMWIGRLEIMTVIALLHPSVWKHLSVKRS